jgi:diguanylate cyclase (GGDEF)-like protein
VSAQIDALERQASEPPPVSAERGRLARLGDIVLGTDPKLRSRVGIGLLPILLYLAWCVMLMVGAEAGFIAEPTARFMLGYAVVGCVAFYPWVRSGFSARWQDSGLVLPQMLFATSWAVTGYALIPPLRPAMLQLMCLVQAFGYFSLKPRQVAFTGAAGVAMLLAMLGVMSQLAPPHFDVPEQRLKILLATVPLLLLMLMAMHQSRLRGRLRRQHLELEDAVTQVRTLVSHDALTGLINRKQMQELLEQECARQARTGRAFCVVLVDLDHFKRINDAHGHPVGDEVLCAFARAAKGELRATDTIARWGGEEFLLLMRETDPEPAGKVAVERLRREIAELHPSQSVPELRVSFSAGVAQHRPDEPVDRTIAEADLALYAAKAAGRNCIVVAPAPSNS